ncbi:hypothetical protein PCASD_07964 [Puccinia coronata f. sp. avenae]|uniref:CxC1-like cysteine cluster associated with KDZ transposases domain-containing protein n=1 Tax=Puccinia coronata f. sp. avenae TaxID=200324 RepID=A0A2N5UTF3_9BASI|nr:hypothetical protein PCASD_07964 [Puccinia coronata f. sp. avenae]
MRTFNFDTPIYGNRTSRLRRAANATQYASMAARFRAFQRSAGIREAQENALQDDDILQSTYNDMPTPDRSEHIEDESDANESNQDIECPWVNLYADVTNPIDQVLQSRIEQHRREAAQFNLRSIDETLHPTFMALKYRTQNWTGPDADHSFVNCRCLPHTLIKRFVDTVDIMGQHRRQMSFLQPQTAFSMRLMIFHNDLWNHCHIGTMPFVEALREWLEPRSERLCVKNKNHARDLRKPFLVAVDLYCRLNDMTESLVMAALKLNKQQKLAAVACPACFGPTPPNSEQYPEITRNRLIICLDGNFQHRHHTKASCEEVIRTPRIFLEQSEVDSMLADIRLAEIRHKPSAQASTADDLRNESTWKGCDDTGLMGCCCRHDAAIYLANIHKSGEQRSLPCALINRIIQAIEPNRSVGILYDIGCLLNKFIKLRGLFEEDQGCIQFATSIFHAYVHNWLCQLDYNPRYNRGWGLSDGEGLERMWSYMAPLVSPLRYATRNHRLAAIAHRLKYHNQRGINNLPLWLRRKFSNAVNRRLETCVELANLLNMRNSHCKDGRNYKTGFFMRQWRKQRRFQLKHTEEDND